MKRRLGGDVYKIQYQAEEEDKPLYVSNFKEIVGPEQAINTDNARVKCFRRWVRRANGGGMRRLDNEWITCVYDNVLAALVTSDAYCTLVARKDLYRSPLNLRLGIGSGQDSFGASEMDEEEECDYDDDTGEVEPQGELGDKPAEAA